MVSQSGRGCSAMCLSLCFLPGIFGEERCGGAGDVAQYQSIALSGIRLYIKPQHFKRPAIDHVLWELRIWQG